MTASSLLRRMPLALLLGLALGTAAAHAAETYPDRPITLVVPFAAGGGADVVARLLASKLPAQLGGQSVIVDNKPGASGNIGAMQVARAPADGYTFLLTNSTLTINASLDMRGTPDVRQALAPVSLLVTAPVALGVNSALPARTVAELAGYIRQNNGKLSYSSCGNGTPQHFTGESFKQAGQLDMVHVPYKGCAPAVNDGLGNQVPILFSTIPNLAPHAQAGKLRMLAVASARRVSFMPDVPAIAETAPFAGLDVSVWFGVFAPQGLPAGVREKFERAVTAAMADPAVQKEFRDRYYEIGQTGAAAMSAQIDRDLDMYRELARQSGITLE